MNKVKEFFENHKTGIAIATSLIAGIVIGGTAMYAEHGKYRELEKLLDKYPKYENGMSLSERIIKYATNGPNAFYITGNPDNMMGDIVVMANDIRDILYKTRITRRQEVESWFNKLALFLYFEFI